MFRWACSGFRVLLRMTLYRIMCFCISVLTGLGIFSFIIFRYGHRRVMSYSVLFSYNSRKIIIVRVGNAGSGGGGGGVGGCVNFSGSSGGHRTLDTLIPVSYLYALCAAL